MSIYITPSDSNTISMANFISLITKLNEALNNCGNWVNLIVKLISEIQENDNFSTLITTNQQQALTDCSEQLLQAKAAILATFGVEEPSEI